MAMRYKFKVYVGPVGVSERAQQARDAGLEVSCEGAEHIHVVMPDPGDGWGAIGIEERICMALRLGPHPYPLPNPIQFLHTVETDPPRDFSWASTRAIERERESKA